MNPEGIWYVAGPMTGVPQHNIPLFQRVTAALRNSGYEVVSPCEMDSDEYLEAAMRDDTGLAQNIDGNTWGDFLARDVKLVTDQVTGIVLLPGWEKSRGAQLEAYIGLITRKHFMTCDMYKDELFLSQVSDKLVADTLATMLTNLTENDR